VQENWRRKKWHIPRQLLIWVQENHENTIPVTNNLEEIKIGYHTNKNLIFFRLHQNTCFRVLINRKKRTFLNDLYTIFIVSNEYDFYCLISDLLQEMLTTCFRIFIITSHYFKRFSSFTGQPPLQKKLIEM